MMNAAKSLVSKMSRMTGLSMSPMTGMRQLSVGRLMMTTYNVLTEAEYEERVVKSIKPTLVMCHRPGCQDCKQLSGILEAVVDLKDGLDLVKVDVTNLSGGWIARVRGDFYNPVPTTNAMIDGQNVGKMTGPMSVGQVEYLVNELLKLKGEKYYSRINMFPHSGGDNWAEDQRRPRRPKPIATKKS